jgi:glycine/D-amino acid oxidase-like deaminating enzyme
MSAMSATRASYDFVVAGAGVCALSAARYLARASPTARIAIVTPHAPMSQTSSLSTEVRFPRGRGSKEASVPRALTPLSQHARTTATLSASASATTGRPPRCARL